MKKLLIAAALLIAGKGLIAQDGENNLKNFRFGLKVAPSFNWLRPDDKKTVKDGSVAGIKYGLITEFRLNNVASFVTGIEGSHLGGKLAYPDTAFYFVHDDAFISKEDTAGHKADLQTYILNNRTFKVTYVTIPITLKLKSKEIGSMTYFGFFGGEMNFRAGAKASDKNTNFIVPSGSSFDPTKVDIAKDMNIFAVNLNVGGGIEYNLSGSTSFTTSIHYNRGFLSNTKADSEYLLKPDGTPYKQKAFMDGIAITVGMLF
ncbi:MAG: hypothetical protein FD123_4153 [Bacteroidetes bacterium]|nr:MAG: hypothetical protein FD123_4153 [Bacteroidota bacterium]